ncbi:MAG TPA: HI0074 family nucleotidyltransferase substrate-binding subunit [Kiritimatiellia bacterium]|nr:HI0074 family nucleotidyltransferase substrate-binding subunit [Kiritimatiellia bacterium]
MKTDLESMLATFEQAVSTLREALALPKSDIVRDAAIQRFEYSFELAWKTIRQFARAEGLQSDSPTSAIRAAFRLGWIGDEALWLQMKEDRNLTTHTYDETTAEDLFMRLPEHAALLTGLTRTLKARSKSAFTLMELLVVVGIIGVLVGIVLGISGVANRKSATSRARTDLEQIKTGLEEYRIERGRYYGPISGPVTGLVVAGERFTVVISNYVKDVRFLDPWGRSYEYSNSVPLAYRVWSRGMNSVNPVDDVETGIGDF